MDQRAEFGLVGWVWLMVGLDRLIGGFEFVDWLEVALFDGGLIWFWFDGGLMVVALLLLLLLFFFFFFFFCLC